MLKKQELEAKINRQLCFNVFFFFKTSVVVLFFPTIFSGHHFALPCPIDSPQQLFGKTRGRVLQQGGADVAYDVGDCLY